MFKKILLTTLFVSLSITPNASAQVDADTLFYQVQPNMVKQVYIDHHWQRSEYYVDVRLKDAFHEEYEKLTQEHIGYFLGVTVNENLLDSTLPTIGAAVPNGRFSLGPFNNEDQAKKIREQLVDEK